MKSIRSVCKNFLKNEDGAITIESVLWLPVYALFTVMIVDVSLMFNGQAQAQRTLQDLNRLASSGYYTTEEDLEARARVLLGHLSPNLSVEATIDGSTGVIAAFASIPASDLMAIGTISKFASFDVNVGAWHAIEL